MEIRLRGLSSRLNVSVHKEERTVMREKRKKQLKQTHTHRETSIHIARCSHTDISNCSTPSKEKQKEEEVGVNVSIVCSQTNNAVLRCQESDANVHVAANAEHRLDGQ